MRLLKNIYECMNSCERVNVPHSLSWTLRFRAQERLARILGNKDTAALRLNPLPPPAPRSATSRETLETARTPFQRIRAPPPNRSVGNSGKCGLAPPGWGFGRGVGCQRWQVAMGCARCVSIAQSWAPTLTLCLILAPRFSLRLRALGLFPQLRG